MKKILKKIEVIPLAIKASLAFIIASIIEKGINLITVPIFTRILSEDIYGQISVFNSWKGILNVIISFSLVGGVINNAMLDFEDDRDGFVSSIVSLIFFSSIAFYMSYRISERLFGNFLNYDEELINFIFFNLAFSSCLGIWSIKERFDYKYKSVILISFIVALGSPITSFILIKFSRLNGFYAKIYGDNLILLVINVLLFIFLLNKGKKIINLKYWKYALKFNLPLIPHYLSYIVLSQSDKIMIAKYLGDSKAGIYSLSYTIASILNIFISSINSSFIPWTYKMMKENKYRKIGEKAEKLLLVGGICSLLFILCSPEIIKIMAPPGYYKAIYIIPPVVLGTYFTFIFTFFANIEFYYKKTNYVMVGSLICAVLNILLNLVLIPKYGMIAAGYTTMLSYFCMIIIHYIFMRKIEKNKIYDIKKIFLVIFFISVLAIGCILIYSYLYLRMILIITILILLFFKREKILEEIKGK